MNFKTLLPLVNLFYMVYSEGNKTGWRKITKNLRIAWMEKPPYIIRSSRKPDGGLTGLLRSTVWHFVELGCDHTDYRIESFEVHSINALKRLVQEGKANVGLPVVLNYFGENLGLLSVKVLDHPGFEVITAGKIRKEALDVIVIAVLQAWPLLLITMLLTAIAGVIVWALDSRWNSNEFSKSFLKGSWEGFWWSFVSMTTVGYGDKTPKSNTARVVSILWILTGVIYMAIFVAHVTSVLTSFTLDQDDFTIVGRKVAVLQNQSEYDWAANEGAEPIAYETVDKMISAVKAKEVAGILIDRYTALYYAKHNGEFASLFSIKTIEVAKQITVIVAPEYQELVDCLSLIRQAMVSAVQAITDAYKVEMKGAPHEDNSLQINSPQVYLVIYLLSGVLAVLVILGLVWEILYNKKKVKQAESDPEAIKAWDATIDANTINLSSIAEGEQLIARLKDYIDRIHKATQEKAQERVF